LDLRAFLQINKTFSRSVIFPICQHFLNSWPSSQLRATFVKNNKFARSIIPLKQKKITKRPSIVHLKDYFATVIFNVVMECMWISNGEKLLNQDLKMAPPHHIRLTHATSHQPHHQAHAINQICTFHHMHPLHIKCTCNLSTSSNNMKVLHIILFFNDK